MVALVSTLAGCGAAPRSANVAATTATTVAESSTAEASTAEASTADGGGAERSRVSANQQGRAPLASPPARPEASTFALSGERVCARAQRCCVGFVGMMQQQYEVDGMDPHVCDALSDIAMAGPESDAGCQAAIDAWRQSLEAMSVGVPPACR